MKYSKKSVVYTGVYRLYWFCCWLTPARDLKLRRSVIPSQLGIGNVAMDRKNGVI